MAKEPQLQSVSTAVRNFIERNRATLENFIAEEMSVRIGHDGMVAIEFTAYPDREFIDELKGMPRLTYKEVTHG